MGNYFTKFFCQNNKIEKDEGNKEPSTDEATVEGAMCTPPVIHKTLPIDPRSVTSGIDRTPIEVDSTPFGLDKRAISAIPRHLRMKPYLETDLDRVMLCLSPRKCEPRKGDTVKLEFLNVQNLDSDMELTPTADKIIYKKGITSIEKERLAILGLDPRSPAADFHRTPLLKPKSIERLRARSQECLYRRGSYEADVSYSRFSYCEMSSQFTVPEIQALPDLAACAPKSSDLDDDFDDRSGESDSSISSQSSGTETISASEERLDNESHYETCLGDSSCSEVLIIEDAQPKEAPAVDNDTIKVWRDSSVLEDNPSETESTDSDEIQIIHEKILEVLQEVKCQSDIKNAEVTGMRKRAIKSEIKIVADEKKIFNSSDKNRNEPAKIRTPLGNRSNNGHVRSVLAKSPQQIRNKSIMPKMLQENTPPRTKYSAKSKSSDIQWDPDSTVII
ncbi:uncharacterized protein LOC143375927 isoform X2 [Andrena cerasifolii]|uniref:uncharacterized protein LOC143375927 isoform X2 n=1 Tax=Andrena cerasifolii TaxID=2819439 RepID=UPI0040382E1D